MASQTKFCLMTHGRSGSTWLINSLGALPGVAVPKDNVESNDNELLKRDMRGKYEALISRPLATQNELIQAFFDVNRASPIAGFKSMPERHQDYAQFMRRSGMHFITLERRDIASTAASFLLAQKQGTWRRDGGTPPETCTFTKQDVPGVSANLTYIFRSQLMLRSIPGAIPLYYEDLCEPGFVSEELDALFAQPVRLTGGKPPTSGEQYVTNWSQLKQFVDDGLSQLETQLQEHMAKTQPSSLFVDASD